MALLCVLLAHAWLVTSLFDLMHQPHRLRVTDTSSDFVSEPITIFLQEPEPEPVTGAAERPTPRVATQVPAAAPSPSDTPPSAAPPPESGAITDTSKVDWPLEGKKAAARILAQEAEAERIARMFAGPGGTWASLTKRQRSKLNKFRFKAGVDGLEYDEKGNQIYHISDGCMIVNSGFIACKIGKVKVRGDMFENMREYFDELRLPETNEGNGTEPEALRPPY